MKVNTTIVEDIGTNQLRWYGHVVRMEKERLPKQRGRTLVFAGAASGCFREASVDGYRDFGVLSGNGWLGTADLGLCGCGLGMLLGSSDSMTITTTFVTVLRRFKYLAEKVMYSNHYRIGAVTRMQIARTTMEAGRRRGSGRVLRPRGRAPATPRNRARPREEDTTIALLRQQQEIMAQMVEQQRRTNTVIELLATRLVQVPEAEARAPTPPPIGVRPPTPAPPGHEVPEPPVDRVVPPRTPDRAPDPEAQPEVADWRRIALAMATSAAKAAGRRPTFAGLDTENPAEFLEEYERYSTDAQVPPEKKLSEAIRCLRQTAARWAKFHQATYCYQLAVRARILSRHYDRTKGDSMVDFFMEQAIQLRTLTQPIPECVMVEDLMRLFPENISLLFKSEKPRGERSIQEALDFLERQSVLHPPKLQRPKEAPTPHAPPRRIVSSAAVGEAEGAQPFLGANINKSPIEKRQQDVDGRCFRPGKDLQEISILVVLGFQFWVLEDVPSPRFRCFRGVNAPRYIPEDTGPYTISGGNHQARV
ncbi:hypothetical protein GEV33_010077 [Tenebrio molitor]|uniref:Uncharacterized protein n=1 Tax=Tenebrio molitor TaxID=7067 RepID=A0A8J6HDE9_TENMO|nr:hypothetical protein GEV33_010077 [Tenebrio molitor]